MTLLFIPTVLATRSIGSLRSKRTKIMLPSTSLLRERSPEPDLPRQRLHSRLSPHLHLLTFPTKLAAVATS